jgi:hypothetical protein
LPAWRIGLVFGLIALAWPGRCLAQAASCPAHSEPYATTVSGNVITIHCQCLQGYAMSGGSCPPVAPPPPIACRLARSRVAADREIVARQQEQELASGEDLRGWTELGLEGRKDLVTASATLVAGMYAADAEGVETEVDDLQEAVNAAAETTGDAPIGNELAAINATKTQLAKLQLSFLLKQTAADALEQNSAWELGKQAVNDGFRAAAGADQTLAAQLQDPELREQLLGPAEESTAWNHVLTVLKESADVALDTLPKLKALGQATGPYTRVAAFVADASLADLQIWLSADAAAQGDDNAGALAAAAGVMQAKYRRDVQALATCRD